MAVVSISLPKNLPQKLDTLTLEGGFKNKSDAIRTAMNLLERDISPTKKLKGHLNAVLLLVHDEAAETAFSNARHRYEDIIKTLIHNQIGKEKCLEIFLLEGEAKIIKELITTCRTTGKVEYLKLITP